MGETIHSLLMMKSVLLAGSPDEMVRRMATFFWLGATSGWTSDGFHVFSHKALETSESKPIHEALVMQKFATYFKDKIHLMKLNGDIVLKNFV